MLFDIDFRLPVDKEFNGNKLHIISSQVENGSYLVMAQYTKAGGLPEEPFAAMAIERVQQGVYYASMLDHYINEYSDYKVVEDYNAGLSMREIINGYDTDIGSFSQYGSADNLEQILAHKQGRFVSTERLFVLQLQLMTKQYSGGYRWHKNGPHLGVNKPQAEHFMDEPVIEQFIQFSYNEVKKK